MLPLSQPYVYALDLDFLLAKEENLHKGDYLQKTTDLFTVTGMAVLIHEDPKRLASDTGLHCDTVILDILRST